MPPTPSNLTTFELLSICPSDNPRWPSSLSSTSSGSSFANHVKPIELAALCALLLPSPSQLRLILPALGASGPPTVLGPNPLFRLTLTRLRR